MKMVTEGERNKNFYILLAVGVTAAFHLVQGNFSRTGTAVAAIITCLLAAQFAKHFIRFAFAHNFSPLKWVLAAPLYFALAGFATWAGCMLGVYFLNQTVQAAPQISILETLAGILQGGTSYALDGLLIGIAWAVPSGAVIFLRQPAVAEKRFEELVFNRVEHKAA